MINDRDAHQLRYSTQYAGNLVALNKVPRATGLSWNEAFAAISSVPAEIMGMGGKLGSLKSGRQADVVIWDGDPLELSTQVENVLIDGVEQSLSNRQIRLRDRYRNPAPGALPKPSTSFSRHNEGQRCRRPALRLPAGRDRHRTGRYRQPPYCLPALPVFLTLGSER